MKYPRKDAVSGLRLIRALLEKKSLEQKRDKKSDLSDFRPSSRPSALQCFEELRSLVTQEALDSAAFKISTAALVELGYLEEVHGMSGLDVSNMEQRGPMRAMTSLKPKTATSRTAHVSLVEPPQAPQTPNKSRVCRF